MTNHFIDEIGHNLVANAPKNKGIFGESGHALINYYAGTRASIGGPSATRTRDQRIKSPKDIPFNHFDTLLNVFNILYFQLVILYNAS
jgi:hypothetical protein